MDEVQALQEENAALRVKLRNFAAYVRGLQAGMKELSTVLTDQVAEIAMAFDQAISERNELEQCIAALQQPHWCQRAADAETARDEERRGRIAAEAAVTKLQNTGAEPSLDSIIKANDELQAAAGPYAETLPDTVLRALELLDFCVWGK